MPASGPAGGSAKQLMSIVNMVDRSNFGMCLDSGHHATWGYDIGNEVLTIGDKLFETHFHDNLGFKPKAKLTMEIDHHNPVGLGIINWVKVIRSLWKIGFKGPITFEGVHIARGKNIKKFEDFKRSADITINNWRAFEDLAAWSP